MSVRLGKRLKRAVAQAGLNQKEVAELSGVPYGWVRQVLAGGIMRPDADRLRRLAAVLPVEVDELLGLSDQLGMGTEMHPVSAVGEGGVTAALVAALERQSAAIEALVAVMAVREGVNLSALGLPEEVLRIAAAIRGEALAEPEPVVARLAEGA